MTQKSTPQLHQDCINRFIDLANSLKDEGVDPNVVSACLMSASGVYTTFVVAGNDGGLTESGIEKVVAAYREELARIQRVKKRTAGV